MSVANLSEALTVEQSSTGRNSRNRRRPRGANKRGNGGGPAITQGQKATHINESSHNVADAFKIFLPSYNAYVVVLMDVEDYARAANILRIKTEERIASAIRKNGFYVEPPVCDETSVENDKTVLRYAFISFNCPVNSVLGKNISINKVVICARSSQNFVANALLSAYSVLFDTSIQVIRDEEKKVTQVVPPKKEKVDPRSVVLSRVHALRAKNQEVIPPVTEETKQEDLSIDPVLETDAEVPRNEPEYSEQASNDGEQSETEHDERKGKHNDSKVMSLSSYPI
jgi:hypothetical protein